MCWEYDGNMLVNQHSSSVDHLQGHCGGKSRACNSAEHYEIFEVYESTGQVRVKILQDLMVQSHVGKLLVGDP